jgi:hypothetical protein
MRHALWLIPGLALAGACSVSAGSPEHGDTRPGQRDFQVGTFQSVELAGSPDVTVTVGGAPSVRAEGPQNALDRLDIRVENGALKIGTRRDGFFSRDHDLGRVTIHVTAPALNAASITGSGDMHIDHAEAATFAASIGGSGDMDIGALRAREATFSIAGSGNIRAGGSADRSRISIAGSGDARLDRFQTGDAEVSIVGSGGTRLRASGSVSGSIMGSGDVAVSGTTRCTVSKMGSGDLRCTS